MTPDREYELLARIEQLKDEVQAARTTIMEREQEIGQLKCRLHAANQEKYAAIDCWNDALDRLRAAQSQGAV